MSVNKVGCVPNRQGLLVPNRDAVVCDGDPIDENTASQAQRPVNGKQTSRTGPSTMKLHLLPLRSFKKITSGDASLNRYSEPLSAPRLHQSQRQPPYHDINMIKRNNASCCEPYEFPCVRI